MTTVQKDLLVSGGSWVQTKTPIRPIWMGVCVMKSFMLKVIINNYGNNYINIWMLYFSYININGDISHNWWRKTFENSNTLMAQFPFYLYYNNGTINDYMIMTTIKLYEAPETIIINNVVYYRQVKQSSDFITKIGYYSDSSGACVCSAIENSYLKALRQLESKFIEIRLQGDYIYWY